MKAERANQKLKLTAANEPDPRRAARALLSVLFGEPTVLSDEAEFDGRLTELEADPKGRAATAA